MSNMKQPATLPLFKIGLVSLGMAWEAGDGCHIDENCRALRASLRCGQGRSSRGLAALRTCVLPPDFGSKVALKIWLNPPMK